MKLIECKAPCLLNINNILSKEKQHRSSQHEILAELESHGHPKSRKMTNDKQRNTEEAAE